ncbi:MAG: hypothetical protein Q8N78_10370 [Sulfurimonas sp.]|nr:hypothetical protein [Sulfurimonas sp.]
MTTKNSKKGSEDLSLHKVLLVEVALVNIENSLAIKNESSNFNTINAKIAITKNGEYE